MREGTTLIVSGRRFGTKANAKPLLFWSADGGVAPSALGRKTAWSDRQLRAMLRLGTLKSAPEVYVYVANGDGEVNEVGEALPGGAR
ncbi:hypothetical protein [Piscinibacter terrae]|uniref:Uncharacterized protein n=1 Tax=Piscinibacter terrae TaxID=2496871 RepID=A0A3N7HKA3_9BURK|nr:hypothetical protein [Albitalea terrae]RQP21963.1 hypothetical protein DZC73_26405 [Albitalea terrae]